MISIILFSGNMLAGFLLSICNWKRLHYIVNQSKAHQPTQNKNNIIICMCFRTKITRGYALKARSITL